MYIHEQIMRAAAQIQTQHGLTKEETVAEMGEAIHILLTYIEPDIGTLLDRLIALEPVRTHYCEDA